MPAVCRPPSITGLSRRQRGQARLAQALVPVDHPRLAGRLAVGAEDGRLDRHHLPVEAALRPRGPGQGLGPQAEGVGLLAGQAPAGRDPLRARYWFGRSMSHPAGRGEPMSVPTAARSGIRLIASTPQAIPTPIASAAMSPATRWAACCAEPHCASRVRPPA